MAKLETWYKQDLKRPLVVHKHTDVFNQDSMGNLIGVEVYSDGEPVALSGSISGYCLLADGTTVPAVGASRSGNKASVLIPQTAYSVPGPITITIKNVDRENIATLCATVGIVRQSVSGNLVNPGSVVTDWSNNINAQLQAVQTAADNVGAIVAAPFDENTVYVVGNYVTNNGNLYRITADHASGVAWANTAKVQCTVGHELEALNNHFVADWNLIDPDAASSEETDFLPVELNIRYNIIHAQSKGRFQYSLSLYDSNKTMLYISQLVDEATDGTNYSYSCTFSESSIAYVKLKINSAPSGIDTTDFSKVYFGKGSEYIEFDDYNVINAIKKVKDDVADLADEINNTQSEVSDLSSALGTVPSGKTAQGQIDDNANDISDLKSALITNPVIVESATSTGWRLNQTDGLCTKNSSYNLKKYSVTPGVIYEIVSDDRFQFQSSASVPSSGTNANLIGSPYPSGTYVLIAPVNATHLIVSTPASGSNQQVSIKSGLGLTYSNYDKLKRAIVREKKEPDVILNNWSLLNSGLCASKSGCKILKYTVNEGEIIDLKTTALPYNAASYQFQNSQEVPSSGTNTNLIGSPVLSLVDGLATVPSGATWLMITALIDDTQTGIYIDKAVTDLEADETDLRSRALKYDTKATPDQNLQGWKLRSDGLCQRVSTYQLLKYKVTAGDKIYLVVPLALSGNASYQFQTDASVPSSGTNTYIVGEPKTNAENRKIVVPATATWLIVSALKTDTDSGVYISSEIEAIKSASGESALYDVLHANEDAINKVIASRWLRSTTATPLTFLWFSDIHRDKTSLDRIIKVKNHLKSINMLDETICTGDMVRASSYEVSGSDDFNNFWYNTDGTEDILIAVGNHEYYAQGSQPHGKIGLSEINSYYLQDIANWDVVRESNYPFYYKDYEDQGIRLIVTDPAIQEEADETTWLNGVLDDARTRGLAVVIASHYVRLNTGTEIQSATVIDNNWSDNVSRSDGTKTLNYDWTGSCDIVECVTDFISAGGIFLCYLIGHWHWDIVMHPVGHPDQLIISIAAATPDRVQTKLTSNDLARYEGTRTHDAFNIVTFDAENKIIKCVRVGANMTMYEQPRTAFAYDVANHQFISVI